MNECGLESVHANCENTLRHGTSEMSAVAVVLATAPLKANVNASVADEVPISSRFNLRPKQNKKKQINTLSYKDATSTSYVTST